MKTVAGTVVSLLALTAASPKRIPAPPPIVQTNTPPPVYVPPPQQERYGDWVVGQSGMVAFIASTTNPSDSAFGVYCNQDCVAFINPRISCDHNHQFPALVNSKDGAFAVTLTCKVTKEITLLSMPLTKPILDAMDIGGEIGIAFPMQSGQFQVARFSLTGSMKATLRAYALSPASKEKPGEQGLRDQTL